ncbi:MAG: SLC13 family permease [Anaerolineae bacterium]
MTPDIMMVLGILVVAMLLFVAERPSSDVVALMVLLSLTVTGLVTPEEALSGFSNPAVITVWAVFILSGGLYSTGVARIVGQRVLALAGTEERRLVAVIMLTAALMSAVMNNVGVAALLLPVVMDLSRRTDIPASHLLMPLAYGSLLGGLMTLIGTPPNLLVSGIMDAADLEPFGLLDFTPVGSVVMVAGVAFMVFVGRLLLPSRDVARVVSRDVEAATAMAPVEGGARVAGSASATARSSAAASSAAAGGAAASGETGSGARARGVDESLKNLVELDARQFVLQIPEGSALAGLSLSESRLGSALGLNVVAISREGRTVLAPPAETILQAGDRLVVAGRSDQFDLLRTDRHLRVVGANMTPDDLERRGLTIAEAEIAPTGRLVGTTLRDSGFKQSYDATVLALDSGGEVRQTDFDQIPLRPGDVLLLAGDDGLLAALGGRRTFADVRLPSAETVTDRYGLGRYLLAMEVTEGSALAGQTLAESHLGDAFGLAVVGIARESEALQLPEADTVLQVGDVLIVKAPARTLRTLRALRRLKVERQLPPELADLESPEIGLSGVALSPYTKLAGKTLRDIHFREKYGLNVVAIWRGGRAYRHNLRDMELRFGDALLLHGRRERLRLLGSEPDFLVLTEEAQEPIRDDKAWLAAGIMGLGVLLPVVMGWLPIQIAAIMGAVLMVVTGCLRMDDAYRFIEWKAVFLIAGMLPLGIAMQTSGAAELITEKVVASIGGYGPLAVMAGLFVLTALASQVMPNAAVAVLVAPIAIRTAADLSFSPDALAMTVAISASASFLSPVGHPANILIMGPGGYKFTDYIRVGLPLTIVVLVVTLLVLPLFWPLQ